MFYGVILGIHVLVCILLCLVVLLQSSKGSGLAGGGAFGGGAESTIFGGRGAATFLSKATTIFGAAFMVTSLALTLMGKMEVGRPTSAVAEDARSAPMGTPTQTAPPTQAPPAGEFLPPPTGEGAPQTGGQPQGTPPGGQTPPGGSQSAPQTTPQTNPAPPTTTPNGG
jgi:preprotein translocase subunit SecG